ncbi:MAG: hypothetical protein NG740_05275 [Omnitrophica bacterium]|nr:hypothetical protein [Candidatus Omnitrophota bacterium]
MNIKGFVLSWGMLLLGVLMNVFGIYVIKMKMNSMGGLQINSFMSAITYFFALIKIPLVLVGAVVILTAPLPYAVALSRMNLSVAYPASVALSCLILLPLSVMFLGEPLLWGKSVAIGLLVVSLYLLYK